MNAQCQYPIEASKFGGRAEHSTEAEHLLSVANRLRQACKDAWILLDALGPHATDDTKLAVLKSNAFAAAAFSVQSALILSRSLDD